MLGTDGLQALARVVRQTAEGFLLHLVGDARLDEDAVGVDGAAAEVPIPHWPQLGDGQARQLRDPRGDGCLFLVHHNFSC
jgi:hypothetical protein